MIDISPSDRLGDERESVYWTRSNAERWIELGRKDALKTLQPSLEKLNQLTAA